MALVASELACVKRDRTLFENLSFSMTSGDLLHLRGPNGAGKTSLLRILTGLSSPASGLVTYNQKPLFDADSEYFEALVYVGHKAGLNQHLSAMDNLRFWSAQQRLGFESETAFDVLEKLGLTGLEEMPVRFLSAGQQRRVALSRLWLKPSRVWILDEPFTALDVEGVALLEQRFNEHVEKGGMILTTSHQVLSERIAKYKVLDLEYRF